MSPLLTLARVLHLLLAGLWFGGVALALVADRRLEPWLDSAQAVDAVRWGLFEVLQNGLLLVAGPGTLATLVLGWGGQAVPLRRRLWAAVIGLAAAAVGSRYLAPRRDELMLALGRRLEDASPDAPMVQELLQLGQMGGLVLWVELIAAGVLLLSVVAPGRERRRSFGIEL